MGIPGSAKDRRAGRCLPVPAGLLGMLVLVAGIEGLVASRALDVTSPATLTWTLSAEAARDEARQCRLLCFGSSLVKHGLLPGVLEPELDGRAFNLAVCAAQAPTSYYLLQHAIEAGARPEAVVIGFAPDLLTGGPEHNVRNWPELLDLGDCLELARTARDPELFARIALGRLCPSYRCRLEARDWIAGLLAGRETSPRALNRLYKRHWTVNRGGQFTPPNPAFNGNVAESEHQALLSDRFWCHRVNRRYIQRFLDLAESRGIRVYWLLPPVSPALQARRDASGAEAKFERFIRAIQARHPRLVVLDARRSGYEVPVFQDARHLVADGTLTLSADVASVIVRDTESPGWVALPHFRPLPLDKPFEDVNQSRLALQAIESRDARGEAGRVR